MIVCIFGCPASGKTSLSQTSKYVLFDLCEESCKIIHQDDYIKPVAYLPKFSDDDIANRPDSLRKYNNIYHREECIDWIRLYKDIITYSKEYEDVIIEGHLIPLNTHIVEITDIFIYIRHENNEEEFMERFWSRYNHMGSGTSFEIEGVTLYDIEWYWNIIMSYYNDVEHLMLSNIKNYGKLLELY